MYLRQESMTMYIFYDVKRLNTSYDEILFVLLPDIKWDTQGRKKWRENEKYYSQKSTHVSCTYLDLIQ